MAIDNRMASRMRKLTDVSGVSCAVSREQQGNAPTSIVQMSRDDAAVAAIVPRTGDDEGLSGDRPKRCSMISAAFRPAFSMRMMLGMP